MSMADRIRDRQRRKTATEQLAIENQDSSSSLTVLVPAESPVVQRLRMVFDHMTQYISENGDSRYSFILQTVMDEALGEMNEEGPENLEAWFEQFGMIVKWIGSGDLNDLPESMREALIPVPKEIAEALNGTHS